ncbi:MAG TPA: hypothetical protein PKY13_05310 [Microthrixaceae bacterium]|nr:hypothetical protein [Microthrixaceae bacterium]HQF95589.1 hypothetical protein [Microthrixaceae bacterium]
MIRKGEVWGRPVDLDGTEPEASSDAEVARLMSRPLDSPVVLRGGDLYHSLGGRASSPVDLDGPVMALPIDLVAVRVDGVDRVAAAHVVARRRWWSGEFAVAMNGTHLGEWNLGPKAHPNDGLIDVTTGRLDVRDRWEARRRAHTGTHLPHPALSTSRVTSTVWTFDRPTPVYVDGVAVGSARRVELEVQPDRGSVVVG